MTFSNDMQCRCGHALYLHDDGTGACAGCSGCSAFEACNCLDCHAKLYAKRGSCSCSLCADRYRSEIQAALAPVRTIFAMMTPPYAPTPRKAGDTRSESLPTVASVAVGSDAGWRS